MSDTLATADLSPVGPPSDDATLLSPELLYAIRPLAIRARSIAQGVLVGTHMSRRFGSSSEFAEHKLYAPGDELKHLDWKAYARFDRYFVRRYLEEASLDVHLVVDASASMGYAGGARGHFTASKWEVARTLAASIATIAHDQSDATGISIFAAAERMGLPPRSRRDHLHALLDGLSSLEAAGKTDIDAALTAVLARQNRRALVIVISDFLDVDVRVLEPLGVLRRRGADVLILHVLHRDELEFPFDGVVRFEDMESDREVQVDAPGVRAAYLDELQKFLARWRDGAMSRDVRYALAPADAHPVATLKAALATVRSAR
jgi:uncharacterized protein (DUF58 family)